MQEVERKTIVEIGIPSIVLMEKAALAVVKVIKEEVKRQEKIAVICGVGNNGADGIAIARLLHQEAYQVEVITIGNVEKATKEYMMQYRIGKNIGVTFIEHSQWTPEETGWIIDGIFGIGLSRKITGDYEQLINRINGSTCNRIIAIDIPSGLCATTGTVMGIALQAKITVTFGYGKTGLYVGEGQTYGGRVHVADIGFLKESLMDIGKVASILEKEDLKRIPLRKVAANKGTYGKLLVIAGSKGMSGAAYLCGRAAYRTGAGLVKIVTVEENRDIMQIQLPEAIVQGYTKETMEDVLKESCQWATTIIIGPGLGQESYVKDLVTQVLEHSKVPMVLDSDALNTIARNPELVSYLSENMVITPHLKEMSRLTDKTIKEIKADAITVAKEYTKNHQVNCLMKDATSIIVNKKGEVFLNTSGNSSLAKAGTGDVLAGMVGGLLCLGMTPFESAVYGAYLHGKAGVKASNKQGLHGVMATDLLDE